MNDEYTNAQNQTPGDTGSVLQKSLKAGHWSLLNSVLQRVFIIGSFFITARLLTPQDFGTIALAALYPNLLSAFTAIAFDTALTQKKEGEEKPYLNIVWTFDVLRSVLVFGIVYFTSPYLATFFHVGDAVLLFQLSAIPVLIQGFVNVGQIYFFRRLDFKKVFLRDIANYGTAAMVSIIAAVSLHSYWALFIGSTSGVFMALVASYILNEYRPKIDFKFYKLKMILNYSGWVFGQGLVTRTTQTLQTSLIGYYTNPTSVGYFTKAKSLVDAPEAFSNVVNKIGFSSLVATGGSVAHAREGFYKSFETSVVIAMPFAVAIFIFGSDFVLLALGASWIGIIPLLKALAIVSALNTMVVSISRMIFNALGKPDYFFYLNMLVLVSLTLLLPYLVITKGIIGAAHALIISAVIVNVCALFLLQKSIFLRWGRLIETTLVTLLASLTPLPLVLYILNLWPQSIICFLISVLLYGVLFFLIITFFGVIIKKGPYKTLALITASFLPRNIYSKKLQ